MSEKILLASDHAGFALKRVLFDWLTENGYNPIDLGAHDESSVDYPDFGHALAKEMATGSSLRGVLVCGTGIGISMAANKHAHIRATTCHSTTEARLCREHNDANVIAFGARTMGQETVLDCLSVFLNTPFGEGRHARRVAKI